MYLTEEGLRDKVCGNCKVRSATMWFQYGILDPIHGGCAPYCEICVLEAQLETARAYAEQIPELEGRLKALRLADAKAAIAELTREAEDLGLYDDVTNRRSDDDV